jgi:hypothetical protein
MRGRDRVSRYLIRFRLKEFNENTERVPLTANRQNGYCMAAMSELTVNEQSLSALALEYQRDYGNALRDLNVLDLVNNPAASGKCCIFGLSFGEKIGNLRIAKFGSVPDNGPDALLICKDGI